MKWKKLGILGAIIVFSVAVSLVKPTVAVFAAEGDGKPATTAEICEKKTFFGFKPWYAGLCKNADGDLKEVCADDEKGSCGSGIGLNTFVWMIVLNIIFDVSLGLGYIAVGMVIYGGYLYIMSQGDPGKMAKGKKTLMSAIIGVIITMGASVIVNTARIILNITSNSWQENNTGDLNNTYIQNIFGWAYGMAGLVAVIFIIKGGLDYMLSSGNSTKAHKALMGMIGAVVGLIEFEWIWMNLKYILIISILSCCNKRYAPMATYITYNITMR